MMMKQMKLTEGKVFPVLIRFALPFLAANLLQSLYGGVDLLIVGQFGSAQGVSAVATGSQIMMFVTNIMIGLATGGTVLIGQFTGAAREGEAADTIGTMLSLFAVMAVVLSAVMALLSPQLAAWMHAPKGAYEYTVEYVFVCSCGVLFIIGYNMVSGILRGLGDSNTPLLFVAAACCANIGLDLLFVAGFHMGAMGAALATIMAQALSLLLAVLLLLKRGLPFPFKKKNLRFSKAKAGKIILIGLPLALSNGLVDISFLIITVIVNSMGVIASAALGVTEKLIGFAMLIPGAFGAAISAMAAQNVGAGLYARAKACLRYGILCSLACGLMLCGICQIIPQTFTALFTKDTQVMEAAALYLKSFSIDCIMVSFVFCFNGYFTGCGKSLFTMLHGVAATFLIRIPVTFLVSRLPQVTMYEMGFAAPLASIFSIFCCLLYLAWTNKKSALQKGKSGLR